MTAWLEPWESGVRVRIRLQPRASRTEIAGEHGDALKIRVSAPPVDGAANRELEKFLAKRLGVPVSQVRVVSGATHRSKVVEIENINVEAARHALAV